MAPAVLSLLGLLVAPAAADAAGYVKSVEYVEIALGTGDLSNAAFLTKNQNVANCVPFASSMMSSAANAFGKMFTDIILNPGSPPTVEIQRGLLGGTVTVGVHVVEFDPTYVKVQQGLLNFASGALGPVNVAITPVSALTRAAMLFYYQNNVGVGAQGYDTLAVEGWFSATNQLRFQRLGTGGTISGHWYAFEALNVAGSFAFAVQTKAFSFSTATGTSTALAPGVGATETIVIGSHQASETQDHPDKGSLRLFLSGCSGSPSMCTTVSAASQIAPNDGPTSVTAFVITFTGYVRVMRGSLSYASGGTQATAPLAPWSYDPAQAMVWNGFVMGPGAMTVDEGSGDLMPEGHQRLKLVSCAPRCTTVQGNRGMSGAAATGAWEAVEFALTTTAVTLASFTATARDASVDLSWTTASELQNLGFHLYRSESEDGPYTRITSSLIPGLGSSATGRSYSYVDSGLVNGRTYFYKLEDVETTGRTEVHGPVSATPVAAPTGGGIGSDSGASDTVYGAPSSVHLREVERSSRHVVLELLTPGFYASPAEDGRVRLSIPDFESLSHPGEPALPGRRALVEAVAGRKIHLASVVASDVVRFPSLRPTLEGVPELEVSEDGAVRPARRPVRAGRSLRGIFPADLARLVGTAFQGERKKAEVLLFPLRFDGRTGQLELSRRLVVRLEFAGAEAGERSLGGSRGRKAWGRRSRRASGVVAQFLVKERGLYRVSYEEVFAAAPKGRGMSTASLKLSRQGESVAFHVVPDRRTFGPGSWLYLLSEGEKLNPYGDAVYELETNQAGLLMAVETLSSSSSGVVTEHFQTMEREENKYYQSGLLDAPDLWQWDVVVSPGTTIYSFTVDHLSLSSSASRLTVDLQGASDFETPDDHHVRVEVNGVVVGEGRWDGKLPKTLELEVGAGILREGENTLGLQNVGDTGAVYSMVFLNRFSLSYPRRLLATGGRLEGRFETSGQAVVEGLSASSALLDTTGVPRWLRGLQDTASGVRFPVQAGRSYLATSVELHPTVRVLGTSSLKSTTNRADYLLLGPREFLSAAQPLLDYRESQGLVTKAVSLEEIYEQFGHGEVSPEAIKGFLEYAYQSWASPSPRYVVLLGDASYDPKDYLKTGVLNRLPGFPTRTSFLWTVSDPAYASVNGEDLIPDLAIGRLPAASLAEAQALVQKVLAFENGGGNFQGRAVLVADNADLAGNFEQDADEIASGVLASRSPQKIYYSQLGGATRAAIRDAIDQGASLVSYVGHGGTVIWASENIFNFQDVATLLPQPQQPLLLTMNCLNGFFHFPPLNSLSEAFLKAEGKGAIGAFSPSGLSINEAAHLYHKALLGEILSGRHERMGDAVLAAQEAYAQTGAFPELLSIYHLFGDPALRIR